MRIGDRLAEAFLNIAGRLFGPVFALEAGRVGRRMSTFVIRWLYLGVLFSVLVMFYRGWRSDLSRGTLDPSVLTRFAENFFWVYSATQFLVVCALTPAFTAATITDEKERKTLDFLLVTDLSGREIVFGKLAARIALLGTLVIAGLPVVALMQFIGGIEPTLLLLSIGMTLATVLSLSAISVASSVLLRRTRDAVVLAYALPIAYLWVSPSPYDLRTIDSPVWRTAVEVFGYGDPFVAAQMMGRSFGGEGVPTVVTNYIAFHLGVTVIGLLVAGLFLRRAAAPRVPSAAPRTRVRRMFLWALGRRTEARSHPGVSDSPVVWREVWVEPNSGGGLLNRLLAIAVLAAVVVPFLNFLSTDLYGYSPWDTRSYFQRRVRTWVCVVTGGLGVLMMLRATLRGASAVAGERDRDTWTSLLTTPLTSWEVVRGKWIGCVLGQRDVLCLLAAVWGVGILTGSVNPFPLLIAVVALGAYLSAFAALGLRFSVSARNSRVAIGRAVPAAIFIGGGFWIVLACCVFGVGSLGREMEIPIAFVMGLTPPFVLGGLPAIDAEFLRTTRNYDRGFFAGVVVGGACGIVGWGLLANLWLQQARAGFAGDANRDADEQVGPPHAHAYQWDEDADEPGTKPWKRPRPPEAPPDSSDSAAPT